MKIENLTVLGKFNKILFLWTLVFLVNIITLLVIYYKIEPGSRPLALDYNVLVGVTWYGEGANLYFLPLIAFLITLANLVLYNSLKKLYRFLSVLCVAASLVVQIAVLSSILLLARVN